MNGWDVFSEEIDNHIKWTEVEKNEEQMPDLHIFKIPLSIAEQLPIKI